MIYVVSLLQVAQFYTRLQGKQTYNRLSHEHRYLIPVIGS